MSPTETQRVAIVTGGSRGIGRSTVLALATAGVDSIFTYNSARDEAAQVVAEAQALGRRAIALQLDLGSTDGFAAFTDQVTQLLTEHWQRDSFDYLVNNAGNSLHKPFADTTEAEFDSIFNVHVKAVFFLVQQLAPLLADGGRIVNISSGLTRFVGAPTPVYAPAKGAVEVLTRYLAMEFGARGITVNTIAPGPIGTDFSGGAVRDNQEMRAMLKGMTALRDIGTPDQVGDAIMTVLTGGLGWVSGERIEVGGGIRI
jgi:NAD(P)-dependent dehydrogenase (short-subunit alcohol dehydrogenase family)